MLRNSKNMRTQLYRRAAMGLTLALVPFVSGCETDDDGPTSALLYAAFAEPVVQSVAATNTTPAPPEPESAEPPTEAPAVTNPDLAAPPVQPPKPAGELKMPPNIRPSSPLAEVVKLAQSGVDAGVMLTYITNSGSTFGLGADEIVYLNDLGMPSEVITAIMEHDRAMKLFWANAQAQTQPAAIPEPEPVPEAAPAEQTAAAPTYVNPPAAEPAPVEQQPANVTYNYFYDTLSPYGSWVNVDGYGMCWQPSVVVVNRGWQPYRDGGRWMYTDAGWYWYSDYTWGWAPFHYGRWFSHPRWGWCWYPDYTWGPSWVSWRYNDGYCGWAPLPPAACYTAGVGFTYYGSSVGVSFGFGLGYSCYTFVPWNRFCNYRPSTYHAPRHHAKDIYHNSTVINNVINGNNNTIINNGVPVERVKAATKSDIQKVALRDVSSAPTRGARRERLDSDGRTLAVHRPQAPQNPLTPSTGSSGSARQGLSGAGTRPAMTQTGQPEVGRTEKNVERSPAVTRASQGQNLSSSERTSLVVERPLGRPAATTPQPRGSVSAQDASGTTTTLEPRAKPIDIPANRSVSRPSPARPAGNSAAGSSRSVERSGTVAPLIVRGSERVNTPVAAGQTAPQASAPSSREQSRPSVVVIGRRETTSSSQRQGIVPATQPESRSVESVRPAPRSSTVNATSERPSYSRPALPQRELSQPRSTPPAARSWQPESSSRPTYSAPVQRPSTPAPSFTPRPSAPSPAPQISRPATPAPAPAVRPQPSAPAVSAPRSTPAPAPAARPAPSSSPPSSRSGNRNN